MVWGVVRGWQKPTHTTNVWKIDEWTQKQSKEFWCTNNTTRFMCLCFHDGTKWKLEQTASVRTAIVLAVNRLTFHSTGISTMGKQGNFGARADSNSGLVSWEERNSSTIRTDWTSSRRSSRLGCIKFWFSLLKGQQCNWTESFFCRFHGQVLLCFGFDR